MAGRHRVRRLMRRMGLEAVYRRPRASVANPAHRVYPYLLRDIEIDRPDRVRCADITSIPVVEGFFYDGRVLRAGARPAGRGDSPWITRARYPPPAPTRAPLAHELHRTCKQRFQEEKEGNYILD